MTYADGEAACNALSENLLPRTNLIDHYTDFAPELSYLAYAGYVERPSQAYFIGDNGVVIANEGPGTFNVSTVTLSRRFFLV